MESSYKISCKDEGIRIDSFLTSLLPDLIPKKYISVLTRSQVIKLLDDYVFLDGNRAKKGNKLKEGQEVTIDIDGIRAYLEGFVLQRETLISSKGDLEIIEETADYIVIYKPKGLVVHPGIGNWKGTLANIVRGYLEEKGGYDSRVARGGIVHRLDKGVSGIMILAKNLDTQVYLKSHFEQRRVRKLYRATVEKILSTPIKLPIVGGYAESLKELEKEKFNADSSWYKAEGFIGRDNRDRKRMKFSPMKENSSYKYSLTYIKMVGEHDMLIKIETGRMHQIRATLRYLGYSIVGDAMYGKGREGSDIQLESVYLGLKLSNGRYKGWAL